MSSPHRCPSRFLSAVLMACSASLTGCGNGLIHTTGIVTLDGQPVANAAVMFLPIEGGRPATGRTDENGRFELTMVRPGDGAAPGAYRITVTACESLVPENESGPITDDDYEAEQLRWIVPQPYSRAETSGLRATVSRKQNDFPLALTTK